MASKLSYYDGCSSNRDYKFIRSVNSFISNVYENKELIIVSDGCNITNRLYNQYFKDFNNIKLIIEKDSSKFFRGIIRQKGIDFSNGDIITFLDIDDEFLPNHLDIIYNNFKDNDWIFMNNYVRKNNGSYYLRESELKEAYIGTSNISYKKSIPISWEGFDGYGHDWKLINKLLSMNLKYEKIQYSGYVIRHLYDQSKKTQKSLASVMNLTKNNSNHLTLCKNILFNGIWIGFSN